jgi:hypothetical protein
MLFFYTADFMWQLDILIAVLLQEVISEKMELFFIWLNLESSVLLVTVSSDWYFNKRVD